MLCVSPELSLHLCALEDTPFHVVLSSGWISRSAGGVSNKYWHLVPLSGSDLMCPHWDSDQNFSHSSPGNGSMQPDLWATVLQYTWFRHFLCYTIIEKELLHLENDSNIFLPSLVSTKHWNSISNVKPIFFMWKYSIYNLVRNDDYENCHEEVYSHEFPLQNIIDKCRWSLYFIQMSFWNDL